MYNVDASSLQIVCRCQSKLQQSVKEKVSMFCHVRPDQVGIVSSSMQSDWFTFRGVLSFDSSDIGMISSRIDHRVDVEKVDYLS